MPCYAPLRAYKTSAGAVVFAERRQHDITHQIDLPCGQCIGCRLERSRQWAMRCVHEASLHKRNCFVTLTYAPEHLPARGGLDYPAFQNFMKRLRKHTGPNRVRFYMCGEYGETRDRPHYHALLFGTDFGDRQPFGRGDSGEEVFTSQTLQNLWPLGFATVGDVTFKSAAYVARYVVQKITGHNAKAHYTRRDSEGEYQIRPEFNKMSLKPGIGAGWYNKYQTDVYPHDYVVINNQQVKPPKYYDKLYAKTNPDSFEDLQYEREKQRRNNYQDNTDDRLKVKEQVSAARLQFKKRTIK